MPENQQIVVELVTRHFQFLLDRGFDIEPVEYKIQSMGYWEVRFKSPDYKVQISNDRSEIGLFLKSGYDSERNGWFSLNVLIYYVSEGIIFVGLFNGDLRETEKQLERLAKIFANHIDKIGLVMGKEFPKHKVALIGKIRTVDQLILEEYRANKKLP